MMKAVLKIDLLLLSIALMACNSGNNDSKLKYTSNMETDYAFNTAHQTNIVKSADAHSGSFVCKIDQAHAFSTTFFMQVSDISKNPLHFVRVSAWIKMESMNAKPLLVVDIRDSTQNSLEWLAHDAFKEVNKINEWHRVNFTIGLSELKRNYPSNFLRIYVSNGEKEAAYVDDISITFEEE